MGEPTVAEATDSIYASLQSDNADTDTHIATLKAALAREGLKEAVFDPSRLAHAGIFPAAGRASDLFDLIEPPL